MDSPGATTGTWLMLGWPGVGKGYNLGRKVPERYGNVRRNQRDSPCNMWDGGDHSDQTSRNAALLHAVLAAVALAEYNDRWQEGIRTWSGRAVPSWAPVWHGCAAEAARPMWHAQRLWSGTSQCDCKAGLALLWGSGLSRSAGSGLQYTNPSINRSL